MLSPFIFSAIHSLGLRPLKASGGTFNFSLSIATSSKFPAETLPKYGTSISLSNSGKTISSISPNR
ncbi:hypothetical protein CUR002 [Staphylococcus phage phiPVL-CN125]|uniref:Uncharacterized protein n=1 Tax=Staphylococcus phage phiPVL-CN125 TaxID=648017 RepID=C5I624_9CAUD|nr:hypothetical protein CUR002 [Staphylococcus phage phiPVL-CN125]ACR54191.1 hypothetical protein CUR002 [Staphylococcus phage phiPVL-CN125]